MLSPVSSSPVSLRHARSAELESESSTDVLLFSDIRAPAYLVRLRALLPPAVAQSREGMLSPVSSSPVSLRHARSAELESESPRRTRRARWRMRPVRVMGESVGDLPILTIQDPLDMQGAIVYDCRPLLLPVSLQLEDIGPLPLRPTVVSASLDAPPREDGMAVSGVSPEGVAIPELGIAPLTDPETDLEDELLTPEDSPSMNASGPEGVCLPGVRPAPPHAFDLELEKALLDVSILPVMVTPLVDPIAQISPTREVADSPILVVFSSYLVSPAGSGFEPVTSPITPSLRGMMLTDHRPVRPRWTSTCREMVICCWGI